MAVAYVSLTKGASFEFAEELTDFEGGFAFEGGKLGRL